MSTFTANNSRKAMSISSLVKEDTTTTTPTPPDFEEEEPYQFQCTEPPYHRSSNNSVYDSSEPMCMLSPRSMSERLDRENGSAAASAAAHEGVLGQRSKSAASFFDINSKHTLDERRRRNKEASARYRAKRNQQNEHMRSLVEQLQQQNNVLFMALQEAYQHQGRAAPRSIEDLMMSMNIKGSECTTTTTNSTNSYSVSQNSRYYPSPTLSNASLQDRL
ncbi:hypothetical protein O0I10_007617 [Lichtheimia ornata]|uniref:BZIP domain-containing protein n=1 Tax=Lichtheimia ornata TaxID=688661 RepID=A0AAD7V004_9FUNG|nr:uncharacterized protein O0I10_007617 [Lichtheimia ornata]KAJ8656769.1 hypothetical protein O0I10_007617 [Lichtheimia ornata]